MKVFLTAILVVFLVFPSCKKDDKMEVPEDHSHHGNHTHDTTSYGTVKLEITNMVDTNELFLDTVLYLLENGDKIGVGAYKYYISNVKLLRANGTWYSEPESYHLVDQDTVSSRSISISNVPEGNYTGIRFMIGVDSARNVSGIQSGDLDPGKGMFWTWSTGYIMAKVEGTSNYAPFNTFAIHIGGFQGPNSALRTAQPSFNGVSAHVSETHTTTIRLKNDLTEWFKTPNAIDLTTTNNVTMVNATSKMIADNYADMFSVTEISH
ncbi:MAG: hypothetical protein K0S33_1085 [Bacteroidetes bacterium]|jgi:hypothetical protein|nr:hypothetical protein [Bacteroidota bacterium]